MKKLTLVLSLFCITITNIGAQKITKQWIHDKMNSHLQDFVKKQALKQVF